MKIPFILLTLVLLSATASAEEIIYLIENAGKLHLQVFDSDDNPVPCTISLVDSNGDSIRGLDVLGNPFLYPGEPRLWISGDTVLSITPDTYQYTISRPYRYESVSGTIDIQQGKSTNIDIQLNQIIDMPSHGWYVGDAHQHIVHGEKHFAVNVEKAAAIARAEGADWSSFNGYWSSVPGDNPSLDEMRERCQQLSNDNYLALVGEEYPKDHLGHMACMMGNIKDWKEEIGINPYGFDPDTK